MTTFLVSHDGIATAKPGPTLMAEIDGDAETGNGPALLRIARRLAADAVGHRMPRGKSRRSLAVKIPAKLAAVDGFSRVALDCVARIAASAELLRQGSDRGGDREAIHQMRVGLRRLRAAFAAFKHILLAKDLETWRKETKWLAGELDRARDLDVFIEHLAQLKGSKTRDDPAWATFGSRLLMMRAAAYEQALAAIESKRFAALIRDCADWAGAANAQPAAGLAAAGLHDGDASVLARQTLNRLHRRLRKAGGHLKKLDPAQRHAARIGAKKLRYAAEFFGGTFGKGQEKHRSRYVVSLMALQDALGDLNDLAMIQQCACAVAGGSAELAFHAGEVIGDRRAAQTRLLAKAARAYGHWRHAKRFWH
jgi:CHAD domain-containing protein